MVTKKDKINELHFLLTVYASQFHSETWLSFRQKCFRFRCRLTTIIGQMQHIANLRLLQAADMYSGQFRSLDLIAVDLEFELQSVQSPDKFTFDKPPVKAARRYGAF